MPPVASQMQDAPQDARLAGKERRRDEKEFPRTGSRSRTTLGGKDALPADAPVRPFRTSPSPPGALPMVRKVRLGSDDVFGGLDPDQRRPDFDDLDDLVLEPPPDKPRKPKPDEPVADRRSPRRKDDPRRHLADADWLDNPRE